MKLGRWLKTKIVNDEEQGLAIANAFVIDDLELRKRRKAK
jgi:hypothetical protein